MSQENKTKIVCIIAMWSLLIYVGYNVLTVEATDLNKEYTWTGPDGHKDKVTLNDFEVEDIPDTCDTTEDYIKNKKLCDNLYDWEKETVEKAAIEDATCDDEDADTTDIKLCMSDDRKAQKESKKACDDIDGAKWTDTGCNIKAEDEDAVAHEDVNEEEGVIEDWGNTVSNEEQIKEIGQNIVNSEQVHGGAELEYVEADNESNDDEPETSSEEATEQEEEAMDDSSSGDEEEESNDSSESEESNEEDNSSE